MKKIAKRAAVSVLAGVMAAGMMTGCGEKELDGSSIAATVNGTEIPLGVVSLYARQQQAQTTAMYLAYMGSAENIWDQTADEETKKTYGDQAVDGSLESIELMCILKEKAADYGVEVTEEDQKAIADAAAEFMAANDEETIKELAVTEEQVKTLLELQTYQQRMYDPVVAEGNIEVTDDEANQSSFTYVSVSTAGSGEEELTEEELTAKKDEAQQILDKMKEDPAADMTEVAQGVNEEYSSVEGHFTTKAAEDEEDTASYPVEVLEVLRGLSDGEVADEIIETDTSYYVVRLDKVLDEEATETERESLKSTKERDYYSETTQKWLDDAKVEVNKKVMKTLKITDSHTFTYKTPETEETTEEVVDETADTTEDAELTEEVVDEAADAEAEPTEEAEDEAADSEAEPTEEAEDEAADAEAEPTEEAEDTATEE